LHGLRGLDPGERHSEEDGKEERGKGNGFHVAVVCSVDGVLSFDDLSREL